MPVLEITAEMVGPRRTYLVISYLQSVMLWPRDDQETDRNEWMKTATVNFIGRTLISDPAAEQAMDHATRRDLYAAAAASIPQHVLDQRANPRMEHGCLAGELLGGAVLSYATSTGKRLKSLKSEMTAPERRAAHRALDVSQSTIDNTIWREFKPISPFWAAYLYERIHGNDQEFPCHLSRLPDFLAWAEFWIRAGTTTPMPQRGERLLDAHRLWQLPPGLPIPRYEIERG